jgi:hypothetical protein
VEDYKEILCHISCNILYEQQNAPLSVIILALWREKSTDSPVIARAQTIEARACVHIATLLKKIDLKADSF